MIQEYFLCRTIRLTDAEPDRARRTVRPVVRSCINQWERFRILKGSDIEIDIEIGPREMMSVQKLNIQDLIDCGTPKPRKILVRKEILLLFHKKPEPEMIDICHFSQRSGRAKR
jgi:hypothetical protein